LVRPTFFQPFAVKDNWNVLPSVSYISVSRYIGIILFGVQGLNKIEKVCKFDPTGYDSRGMKLSNPGDLMYTVLMLTLNTAS
jgi:hypothetical protein